MKGLEIQEVIQKRAYKSSSFLLRWSFKNQILGMSLQNLGQNTGYKKQNTVKNIAILTPKKVFKTAVERNRARRILRSAINTSLKSLLGDSDSKMTINKAILDKYIVITANKTVLNVKNDVLLAEMKNVLNESGIIKL